MELARITSKGQMTVSKRVRDAAKLACGDAVVFVVVDDRVAIRKVQTEADAYLRSVQGTMTEWNSAENEDAWKDL